MARLLLCCESGKRGFRSASAFDGTTCERSRDLRQVTVAIACVADSEQERWGRISREEASKELSSDFNNLLRKG